MPKIDELWTIVQHSNSGFGKKPGFTFGLERAAVKTDAKKQRVINVGGLLFEDCMEADAFLMKAQFTEDNVSGYPYSGGTFSKKKIGGLKIWIPGQEDLDKFNGVRTKPTIFKSYIVRDIKYGK
jgi:hypothetical protein